LGHNVVAGIIYVLTIIVALFQLASGFYLRLPENTFWQKVGVTLFSTQQHGRYIHHILMWYFIIFAFTHIYLVIWNDLKNPDGITSSIFTGNKFRPREIK
jgi:Ni/Fe-hydrogenase 1 B-type cytochrome subunit